MTNDSVQWESPKASAKLNCEILTDYFIETLEASRLAVNRSSSGWEQRIYYHEGHAFRLERVLGSDYTSLTVYSTTKAGAQKTLEGVLRKAGVEDK